MKKQREKWEKKMEEAPIIHRFPDDVEIEFLVCPSCGEPIRLPVLEIKKMSIEPGDWIALAALLFLITAMAVVGLL